MAGKLPVFGVQEDGVDTDHIRSIECSAENISHQPIAVTLFFQDFIDTEAPQ